VEECTITMRERSRSSVGHLITADQTLAGPAFEVHQTMPQLANSAPGPLAQRRDLGAKLARQPFVVVVAEGDQLGVERVHAAVAGSGQARSPGIGQYPYPVAVGQALVRLAAVMDHDSPDVPRVILGKHRGERGAQQLRPVMGREDHSH
jgi:hypothetical protein